MPKIMICSYCLQRFNANKGIVGGCFSSRADSARCPHCNSVHDRNVLEKEQKELIEAIKKCGK